MSSFQQIIHLFQVHSVLIRHICTYFYVIAVLANIPLTAIRANIIDNTRSKAGKYRPYILNMGLPTAVVSIFNGLVSI